MKEKIKAFATTLQIEFTGIAPAEPMNDLREILQDRRRTFGLPDFEEPDLEKRTVPERTLPGAKSIVVCLFPYHSEHCAVQNLAKFAQIPDYHTVVMERLKKLCGFIKGLFPKPILLPLWTPDRWRTSIWHFRPGWAFLGKTRS
ncbi:MAG: QueG-associated DUF1730 domain-containing protein [Eubacteriales bacterium]